MGVKRLVSADNVSGELAPVVLSNLDERFGPGFVKRNALTGWWHVAKDPQVDTTGSTDSSSRVQAYIDAAKSAGGGKVLLPAGTIVAELTMRHRVILAGVGKRETTIKARAGSTRDAVIAFEVGYNQGTYIEDLHIQGNGNAGQHGVHVRAQPIAPDNNGGWWEGGMRRVQIDGLAGVSDCIRFSSAVTSGEFLPHQFLRFEQVFCYASSTAGSTAVNITPNTQIGQMHWDSCEFDGPDVTGRVNTNLKISGGYSITFTNCTTQNALNGFLIDGASEVTLTGCYFENLGRGVDALGSTRSVTIINPHFANAAYISPSDASGAAVRASTGAQVQVLGGYIAGATSRYFASDSSSAITVDGFRTPSDRRDFAGVGMTKQLAVSGAGEIAVTPGANTAIVNTSSVPITKILGFSRRYTGEEITLVAFQGPVTFQDSQSVNDPESRISLSGRGPTLTIPQGGVARFQRFDAAYNWVLVSVVGA